MAWRDVAIQRERFFEGVIPWMYLDGKGFVTVAVGEMLATVEAAQTLPFINPDTRTYATPAEIAVGYNCVRNMAKGLRSTDYRIASNLILSDDAINGLLGRRIDLCTAELRHDFPGFDGYPDVVKPALVDMDLNLGETRLRGTFPRFDAAVLRTPPDWRTAAAECHRQDIGDSRNQWTRAQFLAAAVACS